MKWFTSRTLRSLPRRLVFDRTIPFSRRYHRTREWHSNQYRQPASRRRMQLGMSNPIKSSVPRPMLFWSISIMIWQSTWNTKCAVTEAAHGGPSGASYLPKPGRRFAFWTILHSLRSHLYYRGTRYSPRKGPPPHSRWCRQAENWPQTQKLELDRWTLPNNPARHVHPIRRPAHCGLEPTKCCRCCFPKRLSSRPDSGIPSLRSRNSRIGQGGKTAFIFPMLPENF